MLTDTLDPPPAAAARTDRCGRCGQGRFAVFQGPAAAEVRCDCCSAEAPADHPTRRAVEVANQARRLQREQAAKELTNQKPPAPPDPTPRLLDFQVQHHAAGMVKAVVTVALPTPEGLADLEAAARVQLEQPFRVALEQFRRQAPEHVEYRQLVEALADCRKGIADADQEAARLESVILDAIKAGKPAGKPEGELLAARARRDMLRAREAQLAKAADESYQRAAAAWAKAAQAVRADVEAKARQLWRETTAALVRAVAPCVGVVAQSQTACLRVADPVNGLPVPALPK